MKKLWDRISNDLYTTILATIMGSVFTAIINFLYPYLLSIGSFFLQSISDTIYKEVAKGVSEQGTFFFLDLVLLAFSCLMGYSIAYINRIYKKSIAAADAGAADFDSFQTMPKAEKDANKAEPEVLRKHAKRFRLTLFSVMFIFYGVLILRYSRQSFIHSQAVQALNSIEIVAPYISDQCYPALFITLFYPQSRKINKTPGQKILADFPAHSFILGLFML